MPKNTLTIRLTEAAVYLRTSDNNARRRVPAHDASDARPAMLRGLLTLTIVKPIKITSIDLELQAKTSTSWPEGVGARRIDVQESHKVFSETSVFFRAGPAPRRTASVGPGVDPWQDEDYAYDSPSRPNTPRHDDPQPPMSARAARGLSADSSYFRGMSHDATEHTPPIPPYTPLPTPPSSSSHTSPAHSSNHLTHEDPAHALEDFRNALRAGLSPSTSAAGDRSPGALRSSASSFRDISLSRRPSIDTLEEVDEDRRNPVPGSSSPNRADARGRRARFSLTSVSSVLMEAVRSGSRSSKERADSTRRGRTREKLAVEDDGPRTVLDKVAGLKEDVKDQGKTDSWREFKKGTYTFPISFTIPPNAPPTLQCPYGTVVWRLKANVHRPGAFAARMTAAREVVVIAAPTEDDTEDMENILVERHWEQQLQYLISISGRSFPIGGIVPVTLTLMPLAKVKIHRFSIYLEEKIEYYSQMKHVVRTDPIVRMQLLSVKYDDDKESRPILPLDSNRVDALEESPLLAFTAPGDDLSELASEWMGPGPWSFHQELALPPSCQRLHFTNKNKRGNMCVTHVLKCVIRVERGDDDALDAKTGKRKLFDIVVQTPVHILSVSCRCSPEWTSLPLYSTSFEDPTGAAPSCPCEILRRGGLERVHSHQSSDSAASAAETSPMHPAMPSLRSADTLFARNALFERLMSGQESELGEAPPAYAT
ncbi:hypothetical protein B0H17DRAFT_957201 [Mycena rosella]|uniref:Arrestin C-terminal-like domain-containing protein n=1 Tax=Mycena rosella TaxID=1033263 RepID=A0AAD7CQ68_MYCRO|nr:hypothetical protein B0H17DRAFT_957201 [Mycena rosella]